MGFFFGSIFNASCLIEILEDSFNVQIIVNLIRPCQIDRFIIIIAIIFFLVCHGFLGGFCRIVLWLEIELEGKAEWEWIQLVDLFNWE